MTWDIRFSNSLLRSKGQAKARGLATENQT